MARSPFAIFRTHQKVLMVVLTMLAMFAFVVLDALQTADEIPISLWALIGAGIGAIIFWLLGSSGGKGTEWALVGALLGGVAVLVLPRFFSDPGAVSTSVGNLSEQELFDLMGRRRAANEVIRDVYAAGNPYPERLADIPGMTPDLLEMFSQFGSPQDLLQRARVDWGESASQFQFGPLDEMSIVTTWLLAHEADEMGVTISDETVTEYLQSAASGKLRGQDLTRIRKEHGLSESQLYDILRYELKARQAANLSVPRHLATPEDLWEMYRRLNVRQELVLTPVPVERFVDTDQEPSRAELLEFFERYKNQIPAAGEPGFLQPRKVQLAYVQADFESIRDKLFPEPITEEQLLEYYEQNREEFRNPAWQSEGEGSPATGPALTTPGGEGFDAPSGQDPPAATPPADGSPDSLPAAPDDSAAPADPATDSPPADGDPGSPAADEGQAILPRQRDLVEVAFVQESQADPADVPRDEPASTDPADTSETEEPPSSAAPDDAPAPATEPQQPAAGDDQAAPRPAGRPLPLPPPLPEDPDAPEIPVSEYRSFEDVRELIRSRLEQERSEQVRQEIDRLLDLAGDRMRQLGRAHKAPREDERLTPAQVSERLEEFAREHDLRYVVTDLLSYEELSNETVGQMLDGGAPLADQIFQSGPEQTYLWTRFRDLNGDEIIVWKIEDVESRVPEFTDEGIERQVREAWRLVQARPKAEERAEELAKLVREHPEKDMQQALADETLTGEPGGLEPTVRTTRSFTWLRQSSAPNPSQLQRPTQIEQSTIDGVEQPGDEFMQTVFNKLDEGEVGVVPNEDRSIYYVVKVVNRSTATEAGREVLLSDLLRAPLFDQDQSPYPQMLGMEQQQLIMAWEQRLREKYNLRWNRPLNERTAEF